MTELEIAITAIINVIATAAFAVSGANVAIRKKMDMFGVCVLAVVTAVGGGLFRDLVLGIIPPKMFTTPEYTAIAAATALVVFFLNKYFKFRENEKSKEIYDAVLGVFDSLGLAAFTVIGIQTAIAYDYSSAFLLVFVGMVTGTGGGMFRDVLAGDIPVIFRKHIYAAASMVGAIVCVVLLKTTHILILSMILGAVATFVIRILASKYRWDFPKAE